MIPSFDTLAADAARICSECHEEQPAPLEMIDIKDGEHGPLPYRPCGWCIAKDAAVVARTAMIAKLDRARERSEMECAFPTRRGAK